MPALPTLLLAPSAQMQPVTHLRVLSFVVGHITEGFSVDMAFWEWCVGVGNGEQHTDGSNLCVNLVRQWCQVVWSNTSLDVTMKTLSRCS